QNHVLRRYDFAVDNFRDQAGLDRLAVWGDFKGARLGSDIEATAFRFQLPDGAKQLKRFLLPPPAAPPDYLGKPAGEFTFTSLEGKRVDAKSLEGKVVVLDLWATWCGWCLKGMPNLQKVYDQYQDNDNVAILAVSRDEPTVTDRQVRETMEKTGARVPIVRD